MKQVLNKEIVLDFIQKENKSIGTGQSIVAMADAIGQRKTLSKLLDLVENYI